MHTFKFKLFECDGDDDVTTEMEVPAKWEICDRCEGEGKHSNPAIDGNGITASEWAEWDDEEQEMYMRGDYDIGCKVCSSSGKVLVPDVAQCSDEQKDQLERWEKQEADLAADRYADMRMRQAENGWGY